MKWLKVLEERGWDLERQKLYLEGCLHGDDEKITLHHPINFMTEEEAEDDNSYHEVVGELIERFARGGF